MLKEKYLYDFYIDAINYKINVAQTRITELQETKRYLESVFYENRKLFDSYNISVEGLISHPHTAYSKVSALVYNQHLSRVSHYIKAYSSTARYITTYTNIINKLKMCIMPYNVYKIFVYTINEEYAKAILEGHIVSFSTLGRFFIAEKDNTPAFEHGKYRVCWGVSMSYKKELLKQGEALYNNQTNTGTKYIQFHNNQYDYWWIWHKGMIKNRYTTIFKPTGFFHRLSENTDTYYRKLKTPEAIFKSRALGNINKMRALLTIDPLHYLKYRNNTDFLYGKRNRS